MFEQFCIALALECHFKALKKVAGAKVIQEALDEFVFIRLTQLLIEGNGHDEQTNRTIN